MVKRILVPLDPSPFTQTAIDLASVIAKKSDAELTGLVILDIPGIEDSIGPIPAGGLYYAEKIELAKKVEASQRVEELLNDFKNKCEKNKVRYREAHLQGCPSSEIIKARNIMISLCWVCVHILILKPAIKKANPWRKF